MTTGTPTLNKVLEQRCLRDLSQVDFAEFLGVSLTLVSRMENGYRPSNRYAFKVAQRLGMPLEELWPPEVRAGDRSPEAGVREGEKA